jgi:polar amino acid transport system substrate-binding protein
MKFLSILVVLFLIFGNAIASGENINKKLTEIKWITEEYPPFSYIDKTDGQLKGVMVDILVEVWKKTGLKKSRNDIIIHPWARGIIILEKDPLVCLFGMGISKKRQEKYKFVSSISPGVYGLIAKKSKNYHFDSIEEVNNILEGNGRVIGVVREDFGGKNFVERGGNSALLYKVSSPNQLVKMLALNRFEMIAFGELPAITIMEKENVDPDKYELIVVSKRIISGYAFNKKVDPRIIQVLQKAMDKVIKEGISDKIFNRYIKRLDRSTKD